MDEVSAVQHDPAAGPALAALWATMSGRPADFAAEEQAARREIVARSFAAQLDACVVAFHHLARAEHPSSSAAHRCAAR